MTKTFGGSDLDEAYYHREEAEYERDKVANEVREPPREHFALKGNPAEGAKLGDRPLRRPAGAEAGPQTTDKMYHLEAEMRATRRTRSTSTRRSRSSRPTPRRTSRARGGPAHPGRARAKLEEEDVVDCIKVEVEHQKRVDEALAAMAKIDGPVDPPLARRIREARDERTQRA